MELSELIEHQALYGKRTPIEIKEIIMEVQHKFSRKELLFQVHKFLKISARINKMLFIPLAATENSTQFHMRINPLQKVKNKNQVKIIKIPNKITNQQNS